MAAERIAGVWVILFDDTDQSVGEMSYAAGEVLKIDATASDTSGMAMTLSPTQGGDPIAEFTPASFDGQTGQFRISDADLDAYVAEGETAFINFWTGPEVDALRRGYGSIKRKVSIRRSVTVPTPVISFDSTAATFDSATLTFDEAA